MEIKITKPKTAQINYRKRGRDMSSESIGTNSVGLFINNHNHNVSSANNNN